MKKSLILFAAISLSSTLLIQAGGPLSDDFTEEDHAELLQKLLALPSYIFDKLDEEAQRLINDESSTLENCLFCKTPIDKVFEYCPESCGCLRCPTATLCSLATNWALTTILVNALCGEATFGLAGACCIGTMLYIHSSTHTFVVCGYCLRKKAQLARPVAMEMNKND